MHLQSEERTFRQREKHAEVLRWESVWSMFNEQPEGECGYRKIRRGEC